MPYNRMEAWELFLRTGRISDYMRYSQTGRMMQENDLTEDEDDPDADNDRGAGDRLKGY